MKRKTIGIIGASLIALTATVGWMTNSTTRAVRSEKHYDLFEAHTVAELASVSPVIVQGKVTKNLGSWNLRRDVQNPEREASVVDPGTDYRVEVTNYVRGEGDRTITVTLPGGTYKGVREPAWTDVEVGKEYIFFLIPARVNDQVKYFLTMAPGYFAVTKTGLVPGRVSHAIQTLKPMGLEQLVTEARQTPLAVQADQLMK